MKKEFRAHPLMIVGLVKPFSFILVIPVLKGVVQYLIGRRVTGVLTLELIAFAAITLIAALRCRAFRLICTTGGVTVKRGVFFKTEAYIAADKLSSVQITQNPFDALFRSVTYRINTEAGSPGKPDFEFKLSQRDSAEASVLLYGEKEAPAVRFSAVRVAIMAATTSSAVTGMLIAVPIINKAGKLLGIALENILLDEINSASNSFKNYFPPIVNTITLIFLLSYAVSFVYSFFKYINFKLFLEKDRLEVRSGFFVRSRSVFKKSSVNNAVISQSPLMRIFRRYAMKVSVGGYGGGKRETAIIVPSGRRGEIKSCFADFFPFLLPDGRLLHARRDRITRNRFLYFPWLYLSATVIGFIVFAHIFPNFSRLALFAASVLCAVIMYYAHLKLFEFRLGKLRVGKNIYAQAVKHFDTCELYCPRDNIGEIKLVRTPPDRAFKTCSVVLTVRSEGADSVRVRMLDYKQVLREIKESFGTDV